MSHRDYDSQSPGRENINNTKKPRAVNKPSNGSTIKNVSPRIISPMIAHETSIIDAAFSSSSGSLANPSGSTLVNDKIINIANFGYAFVAQRIAQRFSDWFTNLGLDGRIDVLVIIVVFSLTLNAISNKQKTSLMTANRLMLQEIIEDLKSRLSKNKNDKNLKYIVRDKDVEYFLSKLSLVKHGIQWKTFIENLADFFITVGMFFLVNYCEKFLVILFNLWNVSVETLILVLVPILFVLISLKASVVSYSDVLRQEIRLGMQDLVAQ